MTVYDRCNLDTLIEAYKRHQRRVRGLREKTLHGYERLIRLFTKATLDDDPIDLTRLSPFDVIQFPLDRGPVLCRFDEDCAHIEKKLDEAIAGFKALYVPIGIGRTEIEEMLVEMEKRKGNDNLYNIRTRRAK